MSVMANKPALSQAADKVFAQGGPLALSHTGCDRCNLCTPYPGCRNDPGSLRLENELDELLLPYTFDINRFGALQNPGLVEHIQRVGQVLFRRAANG